MRVVAIEEHYVSQHSIDALATGMQSPLKRLQPSLSRRLADMDAAGIDMQVLSGAPTDHRDAAR